MQTIQTAQCIFGAQASKRILRIVIPWVSFDWDRIEEGWSYELDGDKQAVIARPC